MDDIDVSVTIPGDFWMSDHGFGRKGTGQLRMWETFNFPYSRYLRMVDTSRGYLNVRQEFQAQLSTLCCSEHIWPPSFGWGVPSCEQPGLPWMRALAWRESLHVITYTGRKRHSPGMEESQLSLSYTIIKCSDWMGPDKHHFIVIVLCECVLLWETKTLAALWCWVGCSVQDVTILKENFNKYILSSFDGLKC